MNSMHRIRRAWILLLCVAAASATDFVIEDPNCDDTLTVTMEQLNDPGKNNGFNFGNVKK